MSAPFVVSQSASPAASFVGCVCATSDAWKSPMNISPVDAIIPKTRATKADFLKNSTCCFLRRWYALTERTNMAESMKPAVIVCQNLMSATELNTTPHQSESSALFPTIVCFTAAPAGCCIQPFATSIQSADRFEPMADSQPERR